jgi:hypothetical protein
MAITVARKRMEDTDCLPTALDQRNCRRTPLAQSAARLTLLCDNTTLRNAAVWPQCPNSQGRDCQASVGHWVSVDMPVRGPRARYARRRPTASAHVRFLVRLVRHDEQRAVDQRHTYRHWSVLPRGLGNSATLRIDAGAGSSWRSRCSSTRPRCCCSWQRHGRPAGLVGVHHHCRARDRNDYGLRCGSIRPPGST